jgi:8-oxo-dGTP pyrophosphatase MutT (NUDIX family)
MMHPGPEAKKNEVAVPRDAATVLLLRNAGSGFEVFMVKRSGLSDVLGEAHVFPGGKIDAADSAPAALARVHGLEALDVAALGEDLPRARAAGMFVAAARETFEEAGVLLAHGIAMDLQAARDRVNAKEPLAEVLASLGLMLDAAAMVPWVRWVTPSFVAKRFDARFFLAAAPPEQAAVHDDFEATHSEWLAPATALRRWSEGEIMLAPPTFMSLAHLALFDRVEEVLADARARKPPILQPVAFEEGGLRHLAFPGDARHPVSVRAIPGPTRLKWDGAKFVPA